MMLQLLGTYVSFAAITDAFAPASYVNICSLPTLLISMAIALIIVLNFRIAKLKPYVGHIKVLMQSCVYAIHYVCRKCFSLALRGPNS